MLKNIFVDDLLGNRCYRYRYYYIHIQQLMQRVLFTESDFPKQYNDKGIWRFDYLFIT